MAGGPGAGAGGLPFALVRSGLMCRAPRGLPG